MQRPYYHCAACHGGHLPWDQALGLDKRGLTRGAQEVTTLAGTLNSFPQASQVKLYKLSGLRMSESTVLRVTEAAGERLGRALQTGHTLGEDQAWSLPRDAQGQTCAYVGLDAVSVPQQGPQGAQAEGRMAYVARLYTPQLDGNEALDARQLAQQKRFLAGFYDLDGLGKQLRRQAAQIGWDDVEQQVAISDAGSGLEEFFRQNFPRAEVILDFWHAREHLVELGKAWFSEDPDRQSWLDEQSHRLKQEGGAAVLERLEALDPNGRGPAAREALTDHTRYFRNHAHRMDYPRYVRNGWQIGSGPVESACKVVVAERLKLGGMRWGLDGANALCHLRALFLSQPGQWDAFWQDHPN